MRPYRPNVWVCALAALLAGSGYASAAWDNVFQTCCWGCNRSNSTSGYYAAPVPVIAAAPPCSSCASPCQSCQKPSCSTTYVQRSYYQPVTTYVNETRYEPITTYKTSYYYEPVTTYRYSSYYDPCSGCPQQVVTPVQSYALRSQCSPVTSYLQRTACKPVTSYQLSYYWEPHTSCCQTTVGAPIYAVPAAPATPVVPVVPVPAAPAPTATEGYGTPYTPRVDTPGTPSGSSDSGYRPQAIGSSNYNEPPRVMPPADQSSYRAPQLGAPIAAPAQPAKQVRLDKVVSFTNTNVQGEVLGGKNRAVQANARVLFVSADRQNAQEEVRTDSTGAFRTSLSAGRWLVYTYSAEGRPVYHQQLEVRDNETQRVYLDNH